MKNKIFLVCVSLLFASFTFSQNTEAFSILFYNAENLFDVKDDPETLDEEFTPEGERHWTYKRLNKKLINLSKVILNASGWTPPQIIALCEIENRQLLERLLNDTPLRAFPYKIIHKESPDTRGIDVALIYDEKTFYPLTYTYFPLKTTKDSVSKTREILYVSGILNESDTLHLFVNHWPSRYSGLLESQPQRNLAAKVLHQQIKILQKKYRNPKIVLVGDFNDQPTDESVVDYLKAGKLPSSVDSVEPAKLYNLSFSWIGKELGTLKYQSQWSVFDQIIVSGTLLNKEEKLFTHPEWARIVQLPFLLEQDERYGGLKPHRTYYGFRYHGGFSDHLPVVLKLQINP